MAGHKFPVRRQGSPSVPMAGDSRVFQNIGKYARGAIMYAFERNGGADALADWAAQNPDDFYTKLFPKIVTREVEVENRTVDDLMDVLDGDYEVEADDAETTPAADDIFPDGNGAAITPADFDVDDNVEFPDD